MSSSNRCSVLEVSLFRQVQHYRDSVGTFLAKLGSKEGPKHDVVVWCRHRLWLRLLESLQTRICNGRFDFLL